MAAIGSAAIDATSAGASGITIPTAADPTGLTDPGVLVPNISLPQLTLPALVVPALPATISQVVDVVGIPILTSPDPVARAQAPPARVAHRTAARPRLSSLATFVPADPAGTPVEAPRRDTAAGRTSTASGGTGGMHRWPAPDLPDTPNVAGSASGSGGGLTLLLLAFFAAASAAQFSVPRWRSWRVRLNRDEPHVRPLAKPRDRPG